MQDPDACLLRGYSPSADMWSLGVILYYMLAGIYVGFLLRRRVTRCCYLPTLRCAALRSQHVAMANPASRPARPRVLGLPAFLHAGETPFDDADMSAILERVKAGHWGFQGRCWTRVSEPARDLIRQLLQVGELAGVQGALGAAHA
jgi:hypothetical protein